MSGRQKQRQESGSEGVASLLAENGQEIRSLDLCEVPSQCIFSTCHSDFQTDHYLGREKFYHYLDMAYEKVANALREDDLIDARPRIGLEWRLTIQKLKEVLQNCVSNIDNFPQCFTGR